MGVLSSRLYRSLSENNIGALYDDIPVQLSVMYTPLYLAEMRRYIKKLSSSKTITDTGTGSIWKINPFMMHALFMREKYGSRFLKVVHHEVTSFLLEQGINSFFHNTRDYVKMNHNIELVIHFALYNIELYRKFLSGEEYDWVKKLLAGIIIRGYGMEKPHSTGSRDIARLIPKISSVLCLAGYRHGVPGVVAVGDNVFILENDSVSYLLFNGLYSSFYPIQDLKNNTVLLASQLPPAMFRKACRKRLDEAFITVYNITESLKRNPRAIIEMHKIASRSKPLYVCLHRPLLSISVYYYPVNRRAEITIRRDVLTTNTIVVDRSNPASMDTVLGILKEYRDAVLESILYKSVGMDNETSYVDDVEITEDEVTVFTLFKMMLSDIAGKRLFTSVSAPLVISEKPILYKNYLKYTIHNRKIPVVEAYVSPNTAFLLPYESKHHNDFARKAILLPYPPGIAVDVVAEKLGLPDNLVEYAENYLALGKLRIWAWRTAKILDNPSYPKGIVFLLDDAPYVSITIASYKDVEEKAGYTDKTNRNPYLVNIRDKTEKKLEYGTRITRNDKASILLYKNLYDYVYIPLYHVFKNLPELRVAFTGRPLYYITSGSSLVLIDDKRKTCIIFS